MDRLAAMETFIRVIDTGSFSAAARQLGVGQPAVSKTVAQLEERLSVRLLLRSSHGLSPTEAGTRFYERALRAIEEADEADLAARGAGVGLSGRLRFAAATTFGRLAIIPRLPSFMEAHPGLQIEAILDDRSIDLIGEGIDIALRMGVMADSALTARRIARSTRVVVGAPAYFARAGLPATPADLSQHQAVIYGRGGGGAQWTFSRGGEEYAVTLPERLNLTAAEGVREAVFAGLGLCVTTQWMFGPELADGRVLQVLPEWELPAIDLWAAFPAGRRPSAKARAFAAFVEEELKAPGAFPGLTQATRS